MRFALALLLCLSVPALAQPAPPTAPPAPAPVNNLDKVKCRKQMPIGSLVPKRVCTTERTENQNRDEARNALVRPQHMDQQ
jgi:hypothetical protein